MSLINSVSAGLMRARLKAAFPYIDGAVLDIGCGWAPVLNKLAPGTRYVGVDCSEEIIETLRALHPQHPFYCLDVEADPPPDEQPFDTLMMIAVLEHLTMPPEFLRRYSSMLKQNGTLVITTPSPAGDRIHTALSKVGITRRGIGDSHLSTMGKRELKDLLGSQGFSVEVVRSFELGMNRLVVGRKAAP